MNIVNIKGIKLESHHIQNAIEMACDLMYYGHSFKYFYSNYASLLEEKDALIIWNKAKDKMIEEF